MFVCAHFTHEMDKYGVNEVRLSFRYLNWWWIVIYATEVKLRYRCNRQWNISSKSVGTWGHAAFSRFSFWASIIKCTLETLIFTRKMEMLQWILGVWCVADIMIFTESMKFCWKDWKFCWEVESQSQLDCAYCFYSSLSIFFWDGQLGW